jgi:hypothetical protein
LARTEPSPLGNTLRPGALVDVFLLRTVDAHERFDGFNDSLPVADQVTVGVVWAEPISERAKSRAMCRISRWARLIAKRP